MGLTEKQIQKRWDANVKAVQDAKTAAETAREVWGEACEAVTAVSRSPGFRRRYYTDTLMPTEADALVDAQRRADAAYEAVQAADEAVAEAKATFKAGVPEED